MWRLATLIAATVAICAVTGKTSGGGTAGNFDRLSDGDRQAFQVRFEREVWPLLLKDGKDGCIGCHVANHRSTLKFVGKPDEDFKKLLKDGFFLHNDSANLSALMETKERKKRMPPG